MRIGHKYFPIKEWWAFTDEEIDTKMAEDGALEWWRVWKPILQQIIEAAPAVPTGLEE